jgi:parvulin-like peptidyl-prolyl isomerase
MNFSIRKGLGMLLLTGFLAICFCSPGLLSAGKKKKLKQAEPSEIVAVIGKEPITRERFQAYWDAIPPGKKMIYGRKGGKNAFLHDLVQRKVFVREALAVGLDKDPAVAAELERTRERVLRKALYEAAVLSEVVPDEAVRQNYEENKERYAMPVKIRARHILVTPEKDAIVYGEMGEDAEDQASAQAKIERIKAALQGGADFAEMARKYSEGPEAAEGGDLGFFAEKGINKAFAEAAFSLEAGQMSDVVETEFGYHLILVEKKLAGEYIPLDQVKEGIRVSLASEKQAEIDRVFSSYFQSLREKYGVEIREEALDQ